MYEQPISRSLVSLDMCITKGLDFWTVDVHNLSCQDITEIGLKIFRVHDALEYTYS